MPAFAAPTGFGIKVPVGNGLPLYGFTSPTNNWTVTQWFVPNPLPPFALVPDAGTLYPTYETHNDNDSVKVVLNGTPTVVMSESGFGLPCNTPSGAPQEYDFFFGGSTIATSPETSAYLADTTPDAADNLTLSNMKALMEHGTYQLLKMWYPSPTTACQVNQGSSLISVTLHNSVATPHQTFFYDILLSQSCPEGAPANCAAAVKPFFYNTGGQGNWGVQFGFRDSLTAYGQALVETTKPVKFNLDMLPQIKAVIAEGAKYGMDQDLTHWSISGMYNGEHVWGNIGISSFFHGFIPTPVPLTP